jgi:hypothetical protein
MKTYYLQETFWPSIVIFFSYQMLRLGYEYVKWIT